MILTNQCNSKACFLIAMYVLLSIAITNAIYSINIVYTNSKTAMYLQNQCQTKIVLNKLESYS